MSNDKSALIQEVKSPGYWYVYYLIRDDDFKQEANKLMAFLRAKYPGLTGYDDDWLKKAGATDADINLAHDLARKYETNPIYVYRFATGFYDNGRINPAAARGEVKDGLVVIEFDPRITQDQYRSYWRMFKALRKELGVKPGTRLRGATFYDLIYAVHKARRAGMTFTQIFDLYQSGDLPCYHGATAQFSGPKSLGDYFRRYDFPKQ